MLFSVAMWPLDASDRLDEAVAAVVDMIDRTEVSYRLTAAATLVEGDWGAVMNLVGACRAMLEERYGRVYCVITVDSQPGAPAGQLEHDTAAVERHLGRSLRQC